MSVPENCRVCGLCDAAKTPRMGALVHGTAPVDVLLVGTAPCDSDDALGKHMQSAGGQYMLDWLRFWQGSWAYTTVVRCKCDATPQPHQVEACRVYLQREMERLQPKVVITLGVPALHAMWPDGPRSLAKARTPAQIGRCWIIPTYAPGFYAMKDCKADPVAEYTRVFERAVQICDDKYKVHNPDIREVKTGEDMAAVFAQIQAHHEVTLDIENPTTDKKDDPTRYTYWQKHEEGAITCLGIGTTPDRPVWVMRRHQITKDLLRLLATKTLIGANVKHDLAGLAWDCEFPEFAALLHEHGGIECTMQWNGSVDQSKWGNGLKEMAENMLGVANWAVPIAHAQDVERLRILAARKERLKRQRAAAKQGIDWSEDPIPWPTYSDVPWETLMEYNGKDVYYTMLLMDYLRKHVTPSPAYELLLKPGTPVLAEMELNGVLVDKRYLNGLEKAYRKNIRRVTRRLHEFPAVKRVLVKLNLKCIPGEPKTWFNPKSIVHIPALLDSLGIEMHEKTAKGKPKMDAKIVRQMAKSANEYYSMWDADTKTWIPKPVERRGAPPDDLELSDIFRHISVLAVQRDRLSKFVTPLQQHCNTRDGRVHTNFKPMKVEGSSEAGSDYTGGTESGRLSTSDPALHNQVKDPLFRRAFVAPPGHMLVELDHSSIEPRIAAWLFDCRGMIDIFESGADLYLLMASRIYHVPYKSLTKADPRRNICKTGTLAKLYGQGAAGFADRAGLTYHEACDWHNDFDREFPEIAIGQKEMLRSAYAGEVYRTAFGQQWTWERYAEPPEIVNRPIQATATAMVYYQTIIRPRPTKLIMFTHDSHTLEIPTHKIEEVVPMYKAFMEDRSRLPVNITVPLVAEVKIGPSLGQMKEWKPSGL